MAPKPLANPLNDGMPRVSKSPTNADGTDTTCCVTTLGNRSADAPSSNRRPSKWIGPLLCAAAAILWSTSAFFARAPQFDPWPLESRGAALAFWRAIFALCILVPMVRKVAWDWRLVPMTLCFALMNWTYLTALVGGPPANAIWLQNLAPAWVMLAAVFWLKEPTIPRDWWMLAWCICGVLFILTMELGNNSASPTDRWWAPWLAIASGICYAGVILSLRSLRHLDSAWLISLNHIVTAVTMLPIYMASHAGLPTPGMWPLLIGIGMIQMGTPYFLFAKGLRSTPSHIASLITLLEPVMLPLWVHIARSGEPDYQPPSWWTWVGGLMILAGLWIRYAPKSWNLGATDDTSTGEMITGETHTGTSTPTETPLNPTEEPVNE
jgi:DME family drug/metabolite transporter